MIYFGINYTTDTGSRFLGYIEIPENLPTDWMVGFYRYLKEEKKAEDISMYHMRVGIDSNLTGQKVLRYRTSEKSDLDAHTDMQEEFERVLGNTKYYPKSPSTEAILRAWFNFVPKSKISF